MEALYNHPDRDRDAPLGMSYLSMVPAEDLAAYQEILHMREAIVYVICENDIHMPLHIIVSPLGHKILGDPFVQN